MTRLRPVHAAVRLTYGEHPDQFAALYLPAGVRDGVALPVAVVVHGGFWRTTYGLTLGRPLARDLAAHGVAALNVEYRRVGRPPAGGGWPESCLDVASAVDALAELHRTHPHLPRVDLGRVVALGHSAGGHLVGWLAGRSGLAAGTPGALPRVPLTGFVSQAGVLDLAQADRESLGGSAVAAFVGGHVTDVPADYRAASPIRQLPTGVPSVLVHGTADAQVPLSQSERYRDAAVLAGDDCRLDVLAGVDHFEPIQPGAPAWIRCRTAVLGLLAGQH